MNILKRNSVILNVE